MDNAIDNNPLTATTAVENGGSGKTSRLRKAISWTFNGVGFLAIIAFFVYALSQERELAAASQSAPPNDVAVVAKQVPTAPWQSCPSVVRMWSYEGTPITYIEHKLQSNTPISNGELKALTKSMALCGEEKIDRDKIAEVAREQKAALGQQP